MNNNTCFVVMPIGTQTFNGITLTEEKLREKYDYIIKNAVLKADSALEVIRADDEINPSACVFIFFDTVQLPFLDFFLRLSYPFYRVTI